MRCENRGKLGEKEKTEAGSKKKKLKYDQLYDKLFLRNTIGWLCAVGVFLFAQIAGSGQVLGTEAVRAPIEERELQDNPHLLKIIRWQSEQNSRNVAKLEKQTTSQALQTEQDSLDEKRKVGGAAQWHWVEVLTETPLNQVIYQIQTGQHLPQAVQGSALIHLGQQLSKALGLPLKDSFSETLACRQQAYESAALRDGMSVRLRLLTYEEEGQPKTYLVLAVQRQSGAKWPEQFFADVADFEAALTELGLDDAYNSTLKGWLEGTYTLTEQEQLQQALLKQMNANVVEGVRFEHGMSLSLYTPELANAIQTGGGLMNLQMATRTDVKHQKTLLTIGTPMITLEY